MKNLFTLMFILACCSSEAQSWCPDDAVWHYSVSHGQTAGYQYWHHTTDTIVAGVSCSIINGRQYLTTTGVSDTAITQLGPIYTYSSGDTVFLFDTAFYPVYYFSAQTGDTIYTRYIGTTSLALVDSNGKTVFNGDTLRYYFFHLLGACTDSPSLRFEVIERIGTINTSFVPAWNCSDTSPYSYSLCNYQDSAFATYPDSTTNCTYLSTPVVFNYHHLLDTVNIWHYTYYVLGEKPLVGGSNNEKSLAGCSDNTSRGTVYTSTQSSIQSHTYFEVLVTGAPNQYPSDSCLLGYIREDTTSGKVYFLDPDSINEFLMYDFSMKMGDSIPITFTNNPQYGYFSSGVYTLDSIDSITVFSGVRRRFNLNCHNCGNSHTLTWIEGLGNLADNIYPNCINYAAFQNGNFLVCPGFQHTFSQFVVCYEHAQKVYFDSCAYGESNYFGGEHDSCNYNIFLGGGIQKLTSLSSFTTFPNPTNNKPTVQLNVAQEAGFDVDLRDVEGKAVIYSLHLGELSAGLHNFEMDLSGVSPGFYLVECRTADGSLYSKLVVQR